jgi:hypothetical protein
VLGSPISTGASGSSSNGGTTPHDAKLLGGSAKSAETTPNSITAHVNRRQKIYGELSGVALELLGIFPSSEIQWTAKSSTLAFAKQKLQYCNELLISDGFTYIRLGMALKISAILCHFIQLTRLRNAGKWFDIHLMEISREKPVIGPLMACRPIRREIRRYLMFWR